ncbi:MAG: hypothetical protein ACKO96_23850, partial [Flammeovirgaceae bacterium]
FSKKKEHSWKMKPITSSFNNIAHYSLDSFENARIQVKNVIPYRFKNTINFKKLSKSYFPVDREAIIDGSLPSIVVIPKKKPLTE